MTALEDLVDQLVQITERKDALTQAEAGVRAQIRDLTGPQFTDRVGAYRVNVTPQRRLDLDKAAALVIGRGVAPESVRATGYDRDKIKAHLTPAELDALMVVSGEPRVVVK